MTDLYLHAPDEATLAAALPMLRTTGEDGWIESSPWHALDAGFVVFEGDADDRRPVPGYHANLRVLDGAPDAAALLAAAGPFRTEPATPQRTFAGGPEDRLVPSTISDRQFAQALADLGVISRPEALAFVKRGEVPAALQAAIDSIPDEAERFAADMQVSGATIFERTHPSTLALAHALGWSDVQMDDLWRAAAAL